MPHFMFKGYSSGVPSSSLLFALAIKPLARAVHVLGEIVGFQYGSIQETIALYVDDMLLF